MPHVERSAYLHYSAEQMFGLVADVASYPQFLPCCEDARVIADREGGVHASLSIAYRGIGVQLTTRNAHRYPKQIRMNLLEGPFKSLSGHWRFLPLRPAACRVQLSLNYQFSSTLLSRAVAPSFSTIVNSQVESFAARAEQLYGPP